MIEVGPKANSTGVRTKHALTYLNSPTIDVELVFRVTGKRIARGWAGNPYFHPFIWRGFYIFDLTYDELGRVKTATPVAETAGTLRDDHSEPLEFTWEGGSNRLLAITGKRSGYVRQLHYDGRGRLTKELATFAKKRGEITYEYFQDTPFLVSAKSYDEFYDFRLANTTFDARQNVR
jgi:hypothetical protein